jgi:hypothetical protein
MLKRVATKAAMASKATETLTAIESLAIFGFPPYMTLEGHKYLSYRMDYDFFFALEKWFDGAVEVTPFERSLKH